MARSSAFYSAGRGFQGSTVPPDQQADVNGERPALLGSRQQCNVSRSLTLRFTAVTRGIFYLLSLSAAVYW